MLQVHRDQVDGGRDAVIAALKAANIGTSVHFIPLHLHPYYRDRGWSSDRFPEATAAFDRIVSLPVYPMMGDNDVADVIDAVRNVVMQRRR